MIYRKFKLQKNLLARISEEDKKVVRMLDGVVYDLAWVYEAQLKDGFYPKDVNKEEIEQAGKKDPELLSPFTQVVRKEGELVAIPYHEKYANLLKPIAEKIEKAARTTSNKSFNRYLKLRAKSLLDGSYRDADISWFDVKNCNIDFAIGPFERYLDKLLFIKRAFQAHVGVIDRGRTEAAEQIKETLYTSAKLSPEKYHSTNIPKKGVSIFVEETPATAGYMADVLFSGEHFPSDLAIMQKYGSKIILYRTQMMLKFEKLYYPIFKSIFEKRFASKYSQELLRIATVRNVQLYELGRQLHKFKGARERLKELYGIVDEANGFASGIQHSKYLVVKGLISEEELESMIIMHIVWMFTDWLMYQHNKGKESHVMGNSMLFNVYLSRGALKEQSGISWPNFSRMFFVIEEMAEKLVELLRRGSYQEADNFIKQNAKMDNFKALGTKLGNLDPII